MSLALHNVFRTKHKVRVHQDLDAVLNVGSEPFDESPAPTAAKTPATNGRLFIPVRPASEA